MKKLEETFREMLGAVGKDFSEENLTALFPIKGNKYNRELMVVGRALNGWGGENDEIWWNPKERSPSKKVINNIIEFSLSDGKPGECPMKWIIDHYGSDAEGNINPKEDYYNLKKSAFWRVIKEILSELNITTSEAEKKIWSSYLIWTDLYKVASPEKGGNPSNKLRKAQLEKCKLVLKEEIEFFKPKRLLFLTGYDWFCDFEDIGFKKTKKLHSLVEWVGYYDKTQVVVAKHPQGKDETEYVKQVIKYFQ